MCFSFSDDVVNCFKHTVYVKILYISINVASFIAYFLLTCLLVCMYAQN